MFNNLDRESVGIAVTIVAVVALFGTAAWWRYQHPCLHYEPQWVEAWVEITSHPCGAKSEQTCMSTTYHPAHWVNRCTQYGDREEGDVEASVPPLPPFPPR